jgi:hypothetical protein
MYAAHLRTPAHEPPRWASGRIDAVSFDHDLATPIHGDEEPDFRARSVRSDEG